MPLDIAELRRLAESATPGPWEWWTSNSHRRLSGPDGRDGGILHATVQRDGHPDVACAPENRAWIAAADPTTVLALLDRLAAAESAQLAAERERDEARRLHSKAVVETRDMDRGLILGGVKCTRHGEPIEIDACSCPKGWMENRAWAIRAENERDEARRDCITLAREGFTALKDKSDRLAAAEALLRGAQGWLEACVTIADDEDDAAALGDLGARITAHLAGKDGAK